jgi:hypothetical protein
VSWDAQAEAEEAQTRASPIGGLGLRRQAQNRALK